MSSPRITRAQAAEHFARHVDGQNPPAVQAFLDDLWAGKRQPASETQEIVVRMGQRVGYSDVLEALGRSLGPGVFEFSVDEPGGCEITFDAPPYDGPDNRQGRRAYARMMHKNGYKPLVVRRVAP